MVFSCDCGAIKKDVKQLNDVMRELNCPKCGSKLKAPKLSLQTKLESFYSMDENDKGRMQQLIYGELMKSPGTDSEIAKRLGFDDPNKVRPRRFELVEQGLIQEHGKRPCEVTGRKAIEWVII